MPFTCVSDDFLGVNFPKWSHWVNENEHYKALDIFKLSSRNEQPITYYTCPPTTNGYSFHCTHVIIELYHVKKV